MFNQTFSKLLSSLCYDQTIASTSIIKNLHFRNLTEGASPYFGCSGKQDQLYLL
jgi:hypothetical protein